MRTALAAALLAATSSIAGADAADPVEDQPPPSPVPAGPAQVSYEMELSGASVGKALSGVFRPRTGFSAEVHASAAGTTESGGAHLGVFSAGASLATGGISDRCRYLRVSGTAFSTFERDRERTESAHTSVGVCLFRADVADVTAPGFSITHDMDHAVRPSLSARRLFLTGRYSAHTIRAEGSILEGRDSQLPYAAALFPYRVRVDVADQAGDRSVLVDVQLDGFQILPPRNIIMGNPKAPDAVIHIPADDLAILGLFIRGTSTPIGDVMFGGLDLGRIVGLELGGGVTLDAGLGIGAGGVDAADPMLPNNDVITPRAHVGFAGATGALGWSARYVRDAHPTFDGALALEDRLTSTVEFRRGLPGLSMTAFGAYTQLYTLDATARDWTGGVSAARTWALGDHLALAVTGELAQSYYARLDGDLRPTPSGAARVMAVLTGRYFLR